MKEAVFEALNRINAIEDEMQRATELNKVPALLTIVKFALDPNVTFALPDGDPPFKPADDITTHGMLWQEIRRLYLFTKEGNPNLTQMRRELLYIQMLEAMHPKDADVINQLKTKSWSYNNIDVEFINKFFPNVL